MSSTVFIGLGSNLEKPKQQIISALTAIDNITNTKLTKKSNFYSSKPYNPPANLPLNNYCNAVCQISTTLNCIELIQQLQDIEIKHNRIRTVKFGPRTLDLDILAFDQLDIKTQELTIPHYDLHNRDFVLIPWCEIAPNWHLPNNKTIKQLAEQLQSINKSNYII